MRIAIHTPVGTFVSRILSQEECDYAVNAGSNKNPFRMEGQSGQDIVIPYDVQMQSVFEVMPDEAIRQLPQFDGNYKS